VSTVVKVGVACTHKNIINMKIYIKTKKSSDKKPKNNKKVACHNNSACIY
jgi:hypothetical protein